MTSAAAVGIDWQLITCKQPGTNVLLRTKPNTAGPGLVAENCSKVELLGWGEIIMIRNCYYQLCEKLILICLLIS